jgi:hypothetical protein
MPKKITQSALWPETWPVVGTSGTEYTVGRKRDGTWGCDCPSWMFQKKDKWIYDPVHHLLVRHDCQHILQKKMELMESKGASLGNSAGKVEDINASRSIILEE